MKCADAFFRLLTCIVLSLVPVSTMALERQGVQVQSSDTRAQQAGLVNTAPWNSLTPELAAREWSLTVTEWARYRELMQGRALYFATDMPPLMVLAMYAESDKEQNRFAEMLAQYERDKVERIQKVQRAYDAAMNRLYPNEKIIDLDLLRQQGLLAQSPSAVSGLSQNTADNRTPRFGDTLAIFATPDCSVCADKIRRIVTQYSIAPLEVYFAGEPAAFKEWLQQSEMKTDWLKQHSVTFARDEGQSKQYQAAPGTVFIVRDRALLEMML